MTIIANGIGHRSESFQPIDPDTSVIFDGKGGNDLMTGSSQTDFLVGGLGRDYIFGGASADTIFGDESGIGQGGSGDFLTGGLGEDVLWGGSGNDRMAGNDDGDALYGEDGNDLLLGGFGADTLVGGKGNDRLFGASNNNADQWHTITTPYDGLTGGKYVDTHIRQFNFHDYGVNDTSADSLDGGAGSDRLDGGLGHDTLTGGSGRDAFVFSTALDGLNNLDDITDFSPKADSIDLARAIFSHLAKGGLAADAFHVYGEGKVDAQDRILYQKYNGFLFYDPDGEGPADRVTFAHVAPNTDLTHSDFFVF